MASPRRSAAKISQCSHRPRTSASISASSSNSVRPNPATWASRNPSSERRCRSSASAPPSDATHLRAEVDAIGFDHRSPGPEHLAPPVGGPGRMVHDVQGRVEHRRERGVVAPAERGLEPFEAAGRGIGSHAAANGNLPPRARDLVEASRRLGQRAHRLDASLERQRHNRLDPRRGAHGSRARSRPSPPTARWRGASRHRLRRRGRRRAAPRRGRGARRRGRAARRWRRRSRPRPAPARPRPRARRAAPAPRRARRARRSRPADRRRRAPRSRGDSASASAARSCASSARASSAAARAASMPSPRSRRPSYAPRRLRSAATRVAFEQLDAAGEDVGLEQPLRDAELLHHLARRGDHAARRVGAAAQRLEHALAARGRRPRRPARPA